MAETFQPSHEPDRPCPVCRNADFLWGFVRTTRDPGFAAKFSADDQSFLGGLSNQGSGDVRTRMCVVCRHLDDFVVSGDLPLG